LIPSEDEMKMAQKRVDEASKEAAQLALDAMFDTALQTALLVRSRRERELNLG
jgi:hypothetical protein